jgi:hypothetical protein
MSNVCAESRWLSAAPSGGLEHRASGMMQPRAASCGGHWPESTSRDERDANTAAPRADRRARHALTPRRCRCPPRRRRRTHSAEASPPPPARLCPPPRPRVGRTSAVQARPGGPSSSARAPGHRSRRCDARGDTAVAGGGEGGLNSAEVVLLLAYDGPRPHDAQPAHGFPGAEAVRPHHMQRDHPPR